MIKFPLKQMSVSQAISAAARTRSLMPLQFGLAVATDNRLASKWLNTILSRLGIWSGIKFYRLIVKFVSVIAFEIGKYIA